MVEIIKQNKNTLNNIYNKNYILSLFLIINAKPL